MSSVLPETLDEEMTESSDCDDSIGTYDEFFRMHKPPPLKLEDMEDKIVVIYADNNNLLGHKEQNTTDDENICGGYEQKQKICTKKKKISNWSKKIGNFKEKSSTAPRVRQTKNKRKRAFKNFVTVKGNNDELNICGDLHQDITTEFEKLCFYVENPNENQKDLAQEVKNSLCGSFQMWHNEEMLQYLRKMNKQFEEYEVAAESDNLRKEEDEMLKNNLDDTDFDKYVRNSLNELTKVNLNQRDDIGKIENKYVQDSFNKLMLVNLYSKENAYPDKLLNIDLDETDDMKLNFEENSSWHHIYNFKEILLILLMVHFFLKMLPFILLFVLIFGLIHAGRKVYLQENMLKNTFSL